MSSSSVTLLAALCIQYFFARAFNISLLAHSAFLCGGLLLAVINKQEWKGHWQACTLHTERGPQIALIVTDQQGIKLCVKIRSQLQLQLGQLHFVNWTNTFCNLEKYILKFGQIHLASGPWKSFNGDRLVGKQALFEELQNNNCVLSKSRSWPIFLFHR